MHQFDPSELQAPDTESAPPLHSGDTSAHDETTRVASAPEPVEQDPNGRPDLNASEIIPCEDELAHTRHELEVLQQRYHQVFDLAPDGYIVTDDYGLILEANKITAQMLNVRLEFIVRKPLANYVTIADKRAFRTHLSLLRSKNRIEWETFLRPRGAGEFPVSFTVSATRDEGGEMRLYWLLRDITERRLMEDARANLLRRVVSAQEEERRRVSRELHDQLGQHLTAIMMGLKSLPDIPEVGLKPPSINQRIENLQKMTDDLMQQVHRLAWELRPPALDDMGLETALRRYAEEWAFRAGVVLDIHCSGLEGNNRLPSHIETTLYRVVQEALTNILRHAEASKVSILLERKQAYVTVIIEDNGRGFHAETKQTSSTRLGLMGMQERVALVNGELTIESTPGNGTTIFARVPDERRKLPRTAAEGDEAAEGDRGKYGNRKVQPKNA